jgi:hypothetical protein
MGLRLLEVRQRQGGFDGSGQILVLVWCLASSPYPEYDGCLLRCPHRRPYRPHQTIGHLNYHHLRHRRLTQNHLHPGPQQHQMGPTQIHHLDPAEIRRLPTLPALLVSRPSIHSRTSMTDFTTAKNVTHIYLNSTINDGS